MLTLTAPVVYLLSSGVLGLISVPSIFVRYYIFSEGVMYMYTNQVPDCNTIVQASYPCNTIGKYFIDTEICFFLFTVICIIV